MGEQMPSVADLALAAEYEALAGVQPAAGVGLDASPPGEDDGDRLAAPPTSDAGAVLIGLIGEIAETAARDARSRLSPWPQVP